MAHTPGTSWNLRADDKYKFTVDLKRFGIEQPLPSVEAISVVFNALEGPVREADLGPVRIGKIISNQAQSEAGIYIDLGPTEGATIGARCPRVTNEVELTVGRSSKALRGVVWAALGLGVVAGVWGVNAAFGEWDAQLRLAIGLLVGAALAVGVIVGLTRSGALVTGRSAELADQLAEIVRTWMDGPKPKKKKRRKKRKKKRAVEADDD